MDKNLHNDPLEEFFRKHLKEEETQLPEKDGWDVPSDAVWEGVASGIPKEKPKRRILPYWKMVGAAVAVFLLFVLFQWQRYEQQLEVLTEELRTNEEELEEVKEELQISEKNLTQKNEKEETNAKEQQLIQGEEVVQEELIPSSAAFSSNKKKDVFRSEDVKMWRTQNDVNVVPKNEKALLEEKIVNQTTTNSQYVESVKSKTTDGQAPLYFEELESRSTFISFENMPIPQLFTPELDEKLDLYLQMTNGFGGNLIDLIPPVSNGFYVGANVAPTYGSRKLVFEKTNAPDSRTEKLKGKESAQMTIGGGVTLGYQLNERWSVETGMQVSKLKMQTQHQLEKKYTSDNEMPNSMGELENNYVISLVTSLGDVVDELPFSRPSNMPIPEQTPFDVKIVSKQYLTTIGIPLLLKYSFGKGRTKLSLKAGVMNGFVVDSGMEIKPIGRPFPSFRPHDEKFKNKKLKIADQKAMTFDGVIGAEAEFKLSKSTYFSLAPSFSRSVIPVFEKENTKTFPTVASVKVGMNHYF